MTSYSSNLPIRFCLALSAAVVACSSLSAEEPASATPPDFTARGHKDESHDWQLGSTGLRGWVFFRGVDQTATALLLHPPEDPTR